MKKHPDDDLMEAVHELMHLARSQQRRHMPDDGLHPMEGRALGFFVRRPGATQSDLVEHSGRDKGQLARLIAVLRERGLLEARPDEKDRRVTRLYPTDAARQLHESVLRQRRQVSARAAAGLDNGERQELLRLLRHMQDNLRDADPDTGCT
ncbi:MarR family winged helix-turn-helix transcriptional regulator [Hydrogenophaga sp. MI9]|uniref:MarR family winged helix-turn-helix transcriptional regulator n=1 Tax=Hydrogenophaga sp. MI9 TaxID=3453719 RepID=UPI003EECC510